MSWVCRKPISGMVSEVLISSFRRGVGERVVADEDDLADAGLSPSLISNTRSTRLFGSSMIFGSTRDVEAAVAPVNFDDALHVGLHRRPRQRAARLGLHFEQELLVLELLVALESDAVDDRVLDHSHDQPAAGRRDAHVLEQAGGVERLERLVDGRGVQAAAGAAEIGADGFGFDAAVALDHDLLRALRPSRVSRGDGRDRNT